MRRHRSTFALVILLAVAGCASTTQSGSPAPASSGRSSAFDARAAEVTNAWTAAGMPAKWRTGFVPLQDLTVIAADPGFTSDTKLAFGNGYFVMAAPLLLPPPPGVIRFPDGSTMKVPLQTEEDSFATLDKGDCPPGECHTLRITAVDLSTVSLLTSRGVATVPAWRYVANGLPAPILRVAVAPDRISSPPESPSLHLSHSGDLRDATDLISVDGQTIHFRLGVGDCDKQIRPWVYETSDVIVVGGTATEPAGICDDVLRLQPETVRLATPAGSRAILGVVAGQPLLIGSFR
jgi:hypothetical protein